MADPTKPDWGVLAALLTRQNNGALGTPPPSPLVEALMRARSTPPSTPLGLLGQPTTPALGSLFGTPPSPPALRGLFGRSSQPNALNPFGTPRPAPAATSRTAAVTAPRRSTFFSFHYKDVFRVNHVRNAGVIRQADRERTTVIDRSLWEKVKRTNPAALAMMIRRGLANTTTTVVLAGDETWQREWVRYEIAYSLARGNGLMTVYIDGCQCPRDGFCPRGPNPLSFLALGWNQRLYEQNAWGEWVPYAKHTKPVAWPRWLPRPDRGYVMPLDQGTLAYDWIDDDGRQNLIHWAHAAALAAGK